jgi:hypothetical protein
MKGSLPAAYACPASASEADQQQVVKMSARPEIEKI